MKRNIMDQLIKWNTDNAGKPLLLTGAKGVGKTYMAYEFAKTFFDTVYYLNFEQEDALVSKLKASVHPVEELINRLNSKNNRQITLDTLDSSLKHILILDEITYCPNYSVLIQDERLKRSFPQMIIISSTILKKDPLENVAYLSVSPLSFDEFLIALGEDWYIETIRTHYDTNQPLPEIVHQELLNLHRLYMRTGGYPSAVNEYLSQSSLINLPEQHQNILGSYKSKLSYLYSDSDSLKMIQVLDSIPRQLIKENRKFQYKLIRKGTTHSMYKDGLNTLYQHYYIHPAFRYSTAMLPQLNQDANDSFEENQNFILYYNDVGLLHSSLDILGTDDSLMLKSLLENYCAQIFIDKGLPLRFWESDSIAKVDFILPIEGNYIPVEVHQSSKTRSKNFSVLKEHLAFPYGIKVSNRNFEFSNQVKYLPYYALFCIKP